MVFVEREEGDGEAPGWLEDEGMVEVFSVVSKVGVATVGMVNVDREPLCNAVLMLIGSMELDTLLVTRVGPDIGSVDNVPPGSKAPPGQAAGSTTPYAMHGVEVIGLLLVEVSRVFAAEDAGIEVSAK